MEFLPSIKIITIIIKHCTTHGYKYEYYYTVHRHTPVAYTRKNRCEHMCAHARRARTVPYAPGSTPRDVFAPAPSTKIIGCFPGEKNNKKTPNRTN